MDCEKNGCQRQRTELQDPRHGVASWEYTLARNYSLEREDGEVALIHNEIRSKYQRGIRSWVLPSTDTEQNQILAEAQPGSTRVCYRSDKGSRRGQARWKPLRQKRQRRQTARVCDRRHPSFSTTSKVASVSILSRHRVDARRLMSCSKQQHKQQLRCRHLGAHAMHSYLTLSFRTSHTSTAVRYVHVGIWHLVSPKDPGAPWTEQMITLV